MHKVLFVGVGSIGERHLRCFLRTGRVEAAICEALDDRREQLAQRYDVKTTFDDVSDAAGEGFGVAVIATPANFHIPHAIELARAGVHVLIEKPLSTSLDGIEELQEIIAEKGLKTGVAYTHRSHWGMATVKKAIDSGKFGEPVQIYSVSGQNFPFYRPAYRDIYYNNRATGGGAIQDALTHMANAGEYLVGPIERLTADADHKVLEGVEVEDVVHMITRHRGGIMGCYCLNQFQWANETQTTVCCSAGVVRFDMANNCWMWADDPSKQWQVEKFGEFERDDVYINQANILLDVVEGKRTAPCTLEEGIQTLRVNLAALQSSDEGGIPVNVNG